jgi:NADPH-dependent 2,4-dienoyl-CoA reductase/sulfur reductase-like enzyme
MSKKNIVIVGGGSAGVNAAKTLAKSIDASQYEIVLINPLPYRIWLIATLRLTVAPQEGLKEDILLPYDRVFTNGAGRFVEGTVASFEPSKGGGGVVTLESGEKIPYVAFYFCKITRLTQVDFEQLSRLASFPGFHLERPTSLPSHRQRSSRTHHDSPSTVQQGEAHCPRRWRCRRLR